MSFKQIRIDHLRDSGVVFITKNNDEHVIIETLKGGIDYWPSTNKWKSRSGDNGIGVVDLLTYIGVPAYVKPVALSDISISAQASRVKELEDLLSRVVSDYFKGDLDPVFIRQIQVKLQKAEAHNNTTKLPWD